MRIVHRWIDAPRGVEFRIHRDADDRECSGRCTLTRYTFEYALPDDITAFDAVHADCWALLIALAVLPFVGSRMDLSFPVSAEFAGVFALSGRAVQPVDATIPVLQFTPDYDDHRFVAFNAGVHSTLAAALLPTVKTTLCYMQHRNRPGRQLHRSDCCVLQSLDQMVCVGYSTHVVYTDVMTLVDPPQFATALGCAAGSLLLRAVLPANTIVVGSRLADIRSFGADELRMVSTSSASLHLTYADADFIDSVLFWRNLFGAVALEVEFPTCGFPDPLTIGLLHDSRQIARTVRCDKMRTLQDAPCGACLKCAYYTTLLTAHVKQQNVARVFENADGKYPDAVTACVADVDTPTIWHAFWLKLVNRRALAPPDFAPLMQYYDAFHANQRTVHKDALNLVRPRNYKAIQAGIARVMRMRPAHAR